MRTDFSEKQLSKPDFALSNKALRDCVHCGFCLATCPTYLMSGDERSSPRGRIYLIKELLETGQQPSNETLHHLDTCLSCLGCMTTCPSNVNYRHLIDHARSELEFRVRRPLGDRLLRRLLSLILPYPRRFRLAVTLGLIAAPLRPMFPRRLAQMLRLLRRPQGTSDTRRDAMPEITRTMGLIPGCVQQVLAPEIDAATVRVLERLGVDVSVQQDAGCCGALDHHMGRSGTAAQHMRRHVTAWSAAETDQILATASGCGSMLKDFGAILANTDLAEAAANVSSRAADITEVLVELGYQGEAPEQSLRIAYHGACSLEHGQGVRDAPRGLLKAAGFQVMEVPDGHLCCGSAGSYNVLNPVEADRLLANKATNIATVAPDIIATGNIGCLMQLRSGTVIPVVHTIELLDWAAGGPRPAALNS